MFGNIKQQTNGKTDGITLETANFRFLFPSPSSVTTSMTMSQRLSLWKGFPRGKHRQEERCIVQTLNPAGTRLVCVGESGHAWHAAETLNLNQGKSKHTWMGCKSVEFPAILQN